MAGGNNRIDFQIGFSTDESGLKRLQANLTQIMNIGKDNPLKKLSEGEQDAIQKAEALKNALQKAYSAEIGATNITKLNNELRKSGTNINECRASFQKLGKDGANAYNLLTTQILSSNVKIKETNKLLDKMAVTMANTIRYGISSSIYNNIANSVQKAVNYAEDLDESLTAIRIVSGQSSENMQDFAKQANEAAKALGSTTLDYTDAALIYYQQGLSGSEVIERTNVTMEMANVLGESASKVSNYMTAIWNNFDDGSKSLEYYGDVITALGASTASSAAEISEGLSKFAAIGDTVGLSYEYATTALATVVAETRQSADVVGTAFKTLFARIQDLELGETLDDGTTLGKYSQALEKVGINIKDQTGQLKDMDAILDDMGSKWQTLSKDEQVALAQTVAGTRQYAQLVALMDNWDKFGKNLETAADAAGTLQEKQAIYLESTEAKMKTLKATAQGLYNTIINKDELNSGIEAITNLIKVLDNFLKSFGGGLKSIVGMALTLSSIFSNQLSAGIVKVTNNIKAEKENKERFEQRKEQVQAGHMEGYATQASAGAQAGAESQIQNAEKVLSVTSAITQEQEKALTTTQNEIAELAEKQARMDFILKSKKAEALLDIEEEEVKQEIVSLLEQENIKIDEQISDYAAVTEQKRALIQSSQETLETLENEKTTLEGILDVNNDSLAVELFKNKELAKTLGLEEEDIRKLAESQNLQIQTKEKIKDKLELLHMSIKEEEKENENLNKEYQARKKMLELVEEQQEANNIKTKKDNMQQGFDEEIMKAEHVKNVQTAMNLLTGSISTLSMSWMQLNNVVDIWQNQDMSIGQKLGQTFMSLAMTMPLLITNFSKLKTSIADAKTFLLAYKGSVEGSVAAEKAASLARMSAVATLKVKNLEDQKSALLEQKKALMTELGAISDKKSAAAIAKKNAIEAIDSQVTKINTQITNQNTIAKKANAQAQAQQSKALDENIKAFTADNLKKGLNNLKTGFTKVIGVVKNFGSWLAGLSGAAAVAAGAIAAVTAVVIVGVVWYKQYQAYLKETAKQSLLTAQDKTKLREELQKENEQVKELTDAYKELNKQYKETKDLNKLRTETYLLCNQYGKTSEAIKALTADYDELNEMMTSMEQQSNDNLSASSAEEKATYERAAWTAADAAMGGKTGRRDDWGYGKSTIDLKGMAVRGLWAGDEENKLQSDLESLGVDFINNDHIDYESFIKAATENRTELERILAGSNTEAAEQLKGYMEDMSDALDGFEQAQAAWEESTKAAIANDYNVDNVKNAEQYWTAIGEVANKALSQGLFDTYDEAEAWAKSIMATIDGIGEYALTAEIFDKLYGGQEQLDDNVKSDLFESIDSFTDAEKRFVLAHQQLLKDASDISDSAEDSLKKIREEMDKYSDYIEFEEKQTNYEDSKTTWDATSDGKLEKAEIVSMYKNDANFESDIGYSQQEFENFDYDTQLILLQQYKLEAEKTAYESAQAVKAAYEDAATGIEATEAEYVEKLKNLGDYSLELQPDEDFAAFADRINASQENLVNTIKTHYKEIGELSHEEIIAIMEGYTESGEALDDYIAGLDEESTAYKVLAAAKEDYGDKTERIIYQDIEGAKIANEAAENLGYMTSQYEQATEAIIDHKKNIEELNNTMSTISSAIDDIQSSYSNLLSVQEQYNENGYLTMDSLQKILAMEPEYLQALEWEGNQMTINEESLIKATEAKLDAAEATAVLTAIEELEAIAAGEATEAGIQAEIESYHLAEAYANEANLADAAADANNRLAEARARAEAVNSEAAKKVMDDLNTRLKAIENVRANLGNGNFKNVMKGPDKSKSSSKEKENKERIEEDIDAYHKWEQQIKACTNALDELEERQSHLKGKQLIKNLDAQTAALNRQMEAQKNLNGQYKAQLEYERQRLQSYGVGASFDADGNIANYNQMMQNAQDQYNKAIDAYNASKTDANEAAVETAKNVYDDIKKTVSNYEAALDGVQKAQQAMNELMQKQADVSLAKLEAKWDVELQIDTHKAERDIKSFIKELNEDFTKATKSWKKQFDNAFDLFKNGKLTEDITGQISKMGDIMEWMDDVAARSNAENNFEFQEGDMFTSASDAAEYLISLEEELEELANELKQAYEDAWDAYVEGISQSIEEFERLNNIIDRNNDRLEKMQELMELSYRNVNSIDNQIANREAQLSNNQATINNTENENAMWLKQFNDIAKENGTTQLTLDASGFIDQTKVSIEEMDEVQKAMYERMIENENTLIDSYVKRANLAKEIKDLQIDAAAKQAAQAMFGTSDIDYQRQQWEDALKWQERYYDGQERIYQIESLGHKYDTSISNAKSLKAQEKLNKAKEYELKTLKEKQYLSKDEIALAEKRYQLTLAEIALEEAQSNKNSMKLTRNAEGNWSYQYVADDDDIAQKQQDVIDKTYDFYETAKNAYQNAVSYSYEIYDTYVERYTEIMQNTEISEQERARRLEELNDNTLKSVEALGEETTDYIIDTSTSTSLLIQDIIEEGNIAITDLTTEQQALYQAANLSNLNNLQITRAEMEKENSALALQAKTCLMDTVSTFDTEAGKVVSTWQGQSMVIKSTLENASEDGKRAVQNYQSIVNQCATRIGLDLQEPKRSFEEIKRSTDNAKQASQQYAQQTATGLAQSRGQLSQIKAAWDQVKSAIMQAVNQMQQYIGRTQQAVIACNNLVAAQARAAAAQASAKSSSNSSSNGSGGSGGGSSNNKTATLSSYTGTGRNTIYNIYDSNGSMSYRWGLDGKDFNSSFLRQKLKNEGYTSAIVDGKTITLATGGYTGEWSDGNKEKDNGKLAWLHQKELVLNETDTKNILDAVKSVRDLNVSSIDDAIMSGIANMIIKLSTNSIGNIPNSTSTNTSSNIFHITAEFPNANDVNEIREAIMSLPNLASQYLARR